MIRRHLRRALGGVRDLLIGPPKLPLVDELARRDDRFDAFARTLDFVNYESVPGDIMEFGVFGGQSLALLARAHSFDSKGMSRRVVGFDSFAGLPASCEQHARWRAGDCARTHAWHPLMPVGTPVTPDLVRGLFRACGLPEPALEIGLFEETVPRAIPSRYGAAAVLHVDCDLYESTRDVLEGVLPALQEGTVVLFDDWLHYKASARMGEARAFQEFLDKHREWEAVPWRAYATFCQAFILRRS